MALIDCCRSGSAVPTDPREQLRCAVRSVFESWNSRRARRYRQHHNIPDDLGTAVTVQVMVFGNLDARSGTGVLFSRNPSSGAPVPHGEYLPCAQGEDVVSGKFTPKPLSVLADEQPKAHEELLAAARKLELAARDVQDIEFTVERGKLFFCSRGLRSSRPHAAAQIAVDLVREGMIDAKAALMRLTPDQLRIMLSPHISEAALHVAQLLASGEGASPGVGIGTVVGDADEAERRVQVGEAVVLARPTTSPEDLHGMIASQAVVTEKGGSTSHAAVVGRAWASLCRWMRKGSAGIVDRKSRYRRWKIRQDLRRGARDRNAGRKQLRDFGPAGRVGGEKLAAASPLGIFAGGMCCRRPFDQ